MAVRARTLRQSLASRHLSHPRASAVLHHLARDSEPLGRALLDLTELAEAGRAAVSGARESLSEPLRELSDAKTVAALIRAADQAVSSPAPTVEADPGRCADPSPQVR